MNLPPRITPLCLFQMNHAWVKKSSISHNVIQSSKYSNKWSISPWTLLPLWRTLTLLAHTSCVAAHSHSALMVSSRLLQRIRQAFSKMIHRLTSYPSRHLDLVWDFKLPQGSPYSFPSTSIRTFSLLSIFQDLPCYSICWFNSESPIVVMKLDDGIRHIPLAEWNSAYCINILTMKHSHNYINPPRMQVTINEIWNNPVVNIIIR